MEKSNNIVETILDAQKKAADKFTETAKKMYGENPATDAVEKSKDLYNDWLNKQKSAFENLQEKTAQSQAKSKESFAQTQNFFNSWLEGQMNAAKNMWEMNQNFIKNLSPNTNSSFNPMDWTKGFQNNPFNMWTEGMKTYNNFMNQSNQFQQWMDLMNKFNPSSIMDQSKNFMSGMPNFFNSYFESLNAYSQEIQKKFKNASSQDLYSNLANNAMSFGKFAELWAPFWNSIQDKTFKKEDFKALFNMQALKDLTDNMFKLMPESVSTHYNSMMEQYKSQLQSFINASKDQWNETKDYFQSNNPFNQYNPFAQIMEQYNQFNEWFKSSVAPIAKMATPSPLTKNINAWSEIFDKLAVYSVKNSELQYLMYVQSGKVFESLADNIVNKLDNNQDIESITKLYQEWLNIGDATFVELFESERYSKLMAEVSSIQLKIKKDIDQQMEQYLGQYPIATKSELDELYKIIYDLKKEVRQLEKMLELDQVDTTATKKSNVAKK